VTNRSTSGAGATTCRHRRCSPATSATQVAILNANYLAYRLGSHYPVLYAGSNGLVEHECIIDLRPITRDTGVSVDDVAKRLIDYGFHAPTTYFPLIVPECLLIEPTETESPQILDAFAAAMASIEREAREEPEYLKSAPHNMPVRRLDDVRAAKQLDLTWKPKAQA